MATRRNRRNRRKTLQKKRKTQKGGANLVLGLLGIFKNERMGIREWIDHYKKQGYDHIVLLDNESTDDYREKLKGTESYVHIIPAPGKHKQNEHYNVIGMPKLKELGVNVLSIFDLDEYLFVKDGRTIREYVETFFASRLKGQPGPSGFQVGWSLFGSSGFEKQPESIRKSFTFRKIETTKEPDVKSTFWLADVKPNGLDLHATKTERDYIKYPNELQLNHYVIQSKEFFDKVKRTRGAADIIIHEHVRNDEYFKGKDYKEIEDFALKSLVEQGKA